MKKFSRRSFLKVGGATTAAGAAWVTFSDFWAPRYVRECINEVRLPILKANHTPEPKTWDDNAITATWLGHASVLINFYGLKIMTDPVLFNRIGVDMGICSVGPKRRYASPLAPSDLPKVDLVLLSHAHLDHFDIPSLSTFKPGTKVVTAKNTKDLLQGTNLAKNAQELTWGEKSKVVTENGDVEIEAFSVKHWGARWRHDTQRGYNGYVINRGGKRIIFAGDTALTDTFRDLRTKGPFEMVAMPIGAYNPWITSHCNPEQAVEMANQAGAKYIIPTHHTTFRFGRELYTEPLERLQKALAKEPERLVIREAGETFQLPA